MRVFFASLLALTFTACSPAPKTSKSAMVIKASSYSVSITTDRLETEIAKRGARVFARINHGAGARAIGSEFGDMELLIFGNPKMGAPLMQQRREIGIDLPLKILIWQDETGQTQMGFTEPAKIGAWYQIPSEDKTLLKMRGVLEHITREAGHKDQT